MADIAVSPLSRDGYAAAARVLARAVRNDPGIVSVFRGVSENGRVRRLASALLASMRKYGDRSVVLAAHEDARLVGVCILHPPGAYPLKGLARMRLGFRFWLHNGSERLHRWRELQRCHDGQSLTEPHFVVEMIGVTPAHQKQGVGSALIGHCAELADRAGAATLVRTTNRRNLSLFRRLGYELTVEGEAVGIAVSCLWRPVQARSRRLEEVAAAVSASAPTSLAAPAVTEEPVVDARPA